MHYDSISNGASQYFFEKIEQLSLNMIFYINYNLIFLM